MIRKALDCIVLTLAGLIVILTLLASMDPIPRKPIDAGTPAEGTEYDDAGSIRENRYRRQPGSQVLPRRPDRGHEARPWVVDYGDGVGQVPPQAAAPGEPGILKHCLTRFIGLGRVGGSPAFPPACAGARGV